MGKPERRRTFARSAAQGAWGPARSTTRGYGTRRTPPPFPNSSHFPSFPTLPFPLSFLSFFPRLTPHILMEGGGEITDQTRKIRVPSVKEKIKNMCAGSRVCVKAINYLHRVFLLATIYGPLEVGVYQIPVGPTDRPLLFFSPTLPPEVPPVLLSHVAIGSAEPD